MVVNVDFAKIVGTPHEESGRESWVVVEDNLFLVLEITSFSEGLPVNRGKEIISQIVNDFYNLSLKNLASLSSLIEKIEVEEGINFSLVLGVRVDQAFYLFSRGTGRVFIKRGGKFGILLSQEGKMSGLIKDGDIFLLASPRFCELVSFQEVKEIFDSLSVWEVGDSLTSLVHRAEDTSGVAALILKFSLKEEKKEEKEKTFKKISFFLKKLFSLFKNKLFSKISSFSLWQKKDFYLQINHKEESRRKNLFLILTILVILLSISLFFSFKKKQVDKKRGQFNQIYLVANSQYEQGKALLGLNNLEAASFLSSAKEKLLKLKTDFPKESQEGRKIEELLSQIDKDLEVAKQIFKKNHELFFEIKAIKPEGLGEKLAANKDFLFIQDNKNRAIYQIKITEKTAKILAEGEILTAANSLAATNDKIFILAKEGIFEIEILSSSQPKLKIKNDPDWGEIVELAHFGGNLYLLDKKNGKIWKYVPLGKDFAQKRNYLTEELNLSNINSMAIDGAVWLGNSEILKFVQGKKEDFKLQGLTDSLANNLSIFTNEETKNLYVLEPINKRIIVFEKNGKYKSQYKIEGIDKINDFIVDGARETIFLLSGDKIYSFSLK